MARTPLLGSLRRLVRDARISRRTGIPVDELPDLRAERRLSRRDLLTGAAAGAAVLALPRRVRAAGQPRVVIVGGGIAGLTCALTLRDQGLCSTVYEASGRIGGRMFSNNRGYWAHGQVSEWCGELIDTGHQTIQDLAARYGLALDDVLAAEPGRSSEVYRFGGQYYPAAQATADFLAMFDALQADVDAASYPTLFHSFTAAGRALDHMSIHDWIESRVPGGHGAPLGQLLDVAYTAEYGAESRVQSALNLIYLLGFQSTTTGLDLYGESDERFHIRGGNQLLPQAIADDLGDDVVQTGHRLVRLARTAGGRYRCTFERAGGSRDSGSRDSGSCAGGSREVTADLVVLAIPFAVLADIDTSRAGFDELKRIAIAELGRGHNGKLQLQFARRGWLGTGPWPGTSNGLSYADTGYQQTVEVTRAQPGTPGILDLYSGGDVTDRMRTTSPFATASDPRVQEDVARGLAELAPVYPGLIWNGKATQSLPHKSPFFRNSYSYWKVGQYTRFAGYEGVPLGGVYFCGEHTSIDFQGFMEGGAQTGEQTARDLARLLR